MVEGLQNISPEGSQSARSLGRTGFGYRIEFWESKLRDPNLSEKERWKANENLDALAILQDILNGPIYSLARALAIK